MVGVGGIVDRWLVLMVAEGIVVDEWVVLIVNWQMRGWLEICHVGHKNLIL